MRWPLAEWPTHAAHPLSGGAITSVSDTRLPRRTFLKSGAAGAVAATAWKSRSHANTAGTQTFVLAHPAWMGGWCWQKVAPLLRARGHQVYVPTLTGLGERVHLSNPEI